MSRESPSVVTALATVLFIHLGATIMHNKHVVFDALGAMSLLVAVGVVAILILR